MSLNNRFFLNIIFGHILVQPLHSPRRLFDIKFTFRQILIHRPGCLDQVQLKRKPCGYGCTAVCTWRAEEIIKTAPYDSRLKRLDDLEESALWRLHSSPRVQTSFSSFGKKMIFALQISASAFQSTFGTAVETNEAASGQYTYYHCNWGRWSRGNRLEICSYRDDMK